MLWSTLVDVNPAPVIHMQHYHASQLQSNLCTSPASKGHLPASLRAFVCLLMYVMRYLSCSHWAFFCRLQSTYISPGTELNHQYQPSGGGRAQPPDETSMPLRKLHLLLAWCHVASVHHKRPLPTALAANPTRKSASVHRTVRF